MALTLVSGFSPHGYQEYGRAFIKTFERYWPQEIKIVLYVEESVPLPSLRWSQRSLWDCHGQAEFLEQNKNIPAHNGLAEHPLWGKRDHRDFRVHGFTYRFQALKFSRQLFIPEHAISSLRDGDIMAWFDSDVVTFNHIPIGFVESLIGYNDLVTLGRDGAASELGFWAVTVNDKTRKFCYRLAECCRSGEIFTHTEWHSGYIFDRMADRSLREDGILHRRLTNSGHGHVWFQCELGRYTDHLKGGARKRQGYSNERFGGRGVLREQPELVKAAQEAAAELKND